MPGVGIEEAVQGMTYNFRRPIGFFLLLVVDFEMLVLVLVSVR